ncbi:MAG: glycosyltransferase family 4 protein [Candidatus Yanofskybacteria bacterium]|nr:glycosyltransferase family 4 protein [Candidatus Yanofskybacteria bacterium]
MPKLLMITGDRSLAAGKRGAFYNTLEEFHRYWERVDIICPQVKSRELKVESLFGNVYLHPSPWPLIFQPRWIFKKGKQIYRDQKFNLMTVHEFPPFYNGIGSRILWNMIKVPYVLEIHHIPGYPKAANLKEKVYCRLMKFFVKFDSKKAIAVRVVNRKETPDFLVKAGVAREKIKYIPSMYIDLDVFKAYPEVAKKYDLVFASRLEKNKGIFNLVSAVLMAKKQMPDIKLLIVGSGPEKMNLESRIKNQGLENNIEFSGWLETSYDVAKAYNSAKVFVNPSFNEGGPRVALEAMACGLPVITTRVGIMHDLIKDGESGLFTDWEPKAIAEKITYLLGQPELQKKFGQAGQAVAMQFERKKMIRNYAEELKKII